MAATGDYWVHDLSPFLLRFPENALGLEGIRYYGLAYLLGFLAAWLLLRLYDRKGRFALPADERATLLTAIILGTLAGGRIGYVLLYDLGAFLRNPLVLFRIDQGGMASHGGFLGVIIALAWFSRRHEKSLFDVADVLTTTAPVGIFFGRIANFINGELWGKPTTVSWAVIFPDSPHVHNAVTGFGPEPRHPSQLYAAALEGLLLLAYVQWRFWRARPPAGQLGGEFLVGYAVVRIFGEIFRAPDAPLILGLSRGQFYSVLFFLAGIFVIFLARKKAALQEGGGSHR